VCMCMCVYVCTVKMSDDVHDDSLLTGICTHTCIHIQVSDDEPNKMLADVDEDAFIMHMMYT
jgi:hypothetical protein